MKVNNGVSHPLVGSLAWRPAGQRDVQSVAQPAVHPAARPAAHPPRPQQPPACAAALAARPQAAPAQHAAPTQHAAVPARRQRARRLTLLSVGASAVLLGCASLPSAPWRVEPNYRVQDSSASAAQGWLALAQQHEGEARPAQAIAAYQKAALAAPGDAEVHNALGVALARQGQFAPAVLALRRAVVLAPQRAQLLNNLGYALLLDSRAAEARAIFQLTLAMEPQHAQAGRNLAYADQQLGATRLAAVVPAAAAPVQAQAPADVAATPATSAVAAMPAAAATPAALPSTAPLLAQAQAQAQAPAWPVSLDGVSVEVINGNGIGGSASRLRGWLQQRGISVGRLANLLPYNSLQTQVLYRPGKAEQARSMALRLPVVAHVLPAPAGSTRADLRVLIGRDVIYSAGCAELAACAPTERLATTAALPR